MTKRTTIIDICGMTSIRPTWLGSFFGDNLSSEEYDALQTKLIKTPDRYFENAWFDYRRLHVIQATYYLIHLYKTGYRRYVAKNIDHEKARYVTGLKAGTLDVMRERNAFIRLRSLIDDCGLPYPYALQYLFNFYEKVGRIQYVPRPSHLAALFKEDPTLKETMQVGFFDTESLIAAEDPYYTVFNWACDIEQKRHEDFIVEQISMKPVKRYAIASALYSLHVLRIERAILEFGADTVRDAQSAPFVLCSRQL